MSNIATTKGALLFNILLGKTAIALLQHHYEKYDLVRIYFPKPKTSLATMTSSLGGEASSDVPRHHRHREKQS